MVLNMEDCFLDYTYNREINLVNNTAFPAKYELMPQEELTKSSFLYSSKGASGTINPMSSKTIPLEIQIRRLGVMNSTILVKIIGNGNAPLNLDINANGIGPDVTVSTSELNWGKISVLKPTTISFSLNNTSPIVANFTCGTLSDATAFSVEPVSGRIAPGSSCEITLTAFLEDTVKFTDILKVNVQQAARKHEIRLIARGQGTTIVFNEGLRCVDFGDVFSNCECVAEFVVFNKGKRSQNITWYRDDNTKTSKELRNDSIFEVIPNRFTLKPGTQQTILIKGTSNKACSVREKLCCQSVLEKDPTRKLILESVAIANFINPYVRTNCRLTQFNPTTLNFDATHDMEERCEVIEKSLSLTNTTSLPIHVTVNCPTPFSLKEQVKERCLSPNETMEIFVCLDPDYSQSRISSVEHAKLTIMYKEHPQKDLIDLYSEVNFPNLSFSTSALKFGCIPTDIEQRKTFSIKNKSKITVNYQWYFVEEKTSEADLAQVFDIQPLRGNLEPGCTQTVEVYFFGKPGTNFYRNALCDVMGGPKYVIDIHGEASSLTYAFDKHVLDFGSLPYQATSSQEIILQNTGLVKFDYHAILFPQSSLVDRIIISPAKGFVQPKELQKIIGMIF
jgi:hydrocephalus-inducing protein